MLIMKHHDAYNSISQMPVVLIPIEFEGEKQMPGQRSNHSIVLRTFVTKDFMTGKPAVPGETFPAEMIDEISQTIRSNVPGISRVLYDLTSKPPGEKKQKPCLFHSFLFFSYN